MSEVPISILPDKPERIPKKRPYSVIIIVIAVIAFTLITLAKTRVDGQPLPGISALYEINRNPQTIPIDGSVNNTYELISSNALGKSVIVERYSGKTKWAYNPEPLRNDWLTSPAGTYLYHTTSSVVVAKTNWPLLEKVIYETSTGSKPVLAFSDKDSFIAINDGKSVTLLSLVDGSKVTVSLQNSKQGTIIDINEGLNQLVMKSLDSDTHFIQIYSTITGEFVRQINIARTTSMIIGLNNEYTTAYAQVYPEAEIVSLDLTKDSAPIQQVLLKDLSWYPPEIISPNRQYLLFEPGDEKDNKLALYDLENNSTKEIIAPDGNVRLTYDTTSWSPDSHYLWLKNSYDATDTSTLAYFYDVEADKIIPAVSSSKKPLLSLWQPPTAKALSLIPNNPIEQTTLRFIGWINR